MEKHINYLKKILKEDLIFNADLKEFCSFKIGGIAKIMILPNSINQTVKILKYLNKHNLSYTLLGAGTNVLIKDDLELVICFKKLNKMKIRNKTIFAESGVSLFKLNEFACKYGLSGLEKTYGIPASVGGGIVQNCGAYGKSISDNLKKVVLFDGKRVKTLKKNELFFGYRTSEFKINKNLVVLKGIFKLNKGNKESIQQELNDIITLRKSKQPYEYYSAGSVFKRVDGVIISKLLDEMNLKGYSIGGAKISEKHAGFIINYNNATYDDVMSLIDFVKNKIKIEKNIDLELEIVLL